MIKVEKIVNRLFASNTYVLSLEEQREVWLVDCGDTDVVLRRLTKESIVKGVLFTHTHSDHIYGINELLKAFPETEIYTNTFGKEALGDPRLNITKYHNDVQDLRISHPENIRVLNEGDRVLLYDGVGLDVYETIGHDKSCLTYKIGNILFTGDSYIPGLKVVAKFPNSNKIQAKESEHRIIEMTEGLIIYPGHTIN